MRKTVSRTRPIGRPGELAGPLKETSKMTQQWQLICKVDDIPLCGARVVRRGLAWQELPGVAIFRTGEDRIFVLLDQCPHQGGGVLSDGRVCGNRVACPRHQVDVALESGQAVAPARGCTKCYSVRVEHGNVYLDMNELNAPASRAEAALAGLYAVAPHIQMA